MPPITGIEVAVTFRTLSHKHTHTHTHTHTPSKEVRPDDHRQVATYLNNVSDFVLGGFFLGRSTRTSKRGTGGTHGDVCVGPRCGFFLEGGIYGKVNVGYMATAKEQTIS